nr:hypothetical protein [Kofleriaceae bacterium]
MRVRVCHVAVALIAVGGICAADNDASSSTSPYFSTDGALGVPVFGSFVSLDNWLRPVAGYAIPLGPIEVQAFVDDSRKPELTDPTSLERAASTDVGGRISLGGVTRPGSANEQYLIETCGAHPRLPDCLARDPRLSLGRGASLSIGARATLAPTHVVRGWAGEAIATVSRSPLLAYVSLTVRREDADADYAKLSEQTASAGVSLRAFASPFAGGTYFEVGFLGRAASFRAVDSGPHHTLAEAGLAVQLRVSSLDVAVRCMWERHDVVDSAIAVAPEVSWTITAQPTIFF